MEHPFSFLRPANFSFFDENDGFRGEVDLMGFSFDEEAAHGMVGRIICDARLALAGVPGSAVRGLLWFADAALNEVLKDMKVDVGGKVVPRDSIDFKAANQLDFVHLMLGLLAREKVIIGDEGAADVEVTPSRFCAAYVLRMMFNATREYLHFSGGSDLREYYLMQASVAHGLMKSFLQDEELSISGALSIANQKKVAKRLANTRWSKDPTQAAKTSARELWPEANRKGWTAVKFHAALSNKGHVVAADTVRKWVTSLRQTGTC